MYKKKRIVLNAFTSLKAYLVLKQKGFIFIDTLQGHRHHPILIEPVKGIFSFI